MVFITADGAGQWTAPKVMIGQAHHSAPRPLETRAAMPIQRLSTKRAGPPALPGSGPIWTWFAMTGTCAPDAHTVTVESSVDRVQVVPASDGLVIAAIRTGPDDDPRITVRTHDGRRLSVAHSR